MSKLLTLYSHSSSIEQFYFPAITLTPGEWEIGLLSFSCYNSIPNIGSRNNEIKVGSHLIALPPGAYEIEEINEAVQSELKKLDESATITIQGNPSTFKSEIKCTLPVHLSTLGPVLGFKKDAELTPNKTHVSDTPIKITKVHDIRIECNLVQENFINNSTSNTIFGFHLDVPAGYNISIRPQTVIYYPVAVDSIHELIVRVVDQDGDLIDFQNELITIYLHLKRPT